jgi:hypothetical protein
VQPAGRDPAPADPHLRRIGETGATLARVAGSLGRPGCRVAIDVAEPAPRSYHWAFSSPCTGVGGEPIAGGGRAASTRFRRRAAGRRILPGSGGRRGGA